MKNRLFGVILFVVAFVPRFLVSARLHPEPVWDGHYYDFGARRIAEGMGYSDSVAIAGASVWHPWCHYPVGYSAFLSFFYKVFGTGAMVAQLVNSTVGALVVLFTWLLAQHALSEKRAKLAGVIAALHPGLILYSALTMTEPLATLATLVAFWLGVRDPKPTRGALFAAIVLGISALVRPTVLLVAPFLAFVAIPRGKAATRIAWAAVLSVATLLPVLPWTARNCRVMDGCALVSTNAGWNLAIGAFPRATGRFETLRSSDGCREVTGQVQQDRCWFNYGVDQIKSDPIRWLSLAPKKLAFTFDHESFAVEYLHEANPTWWSDSRRTLARDATTLAHRLLVCAAVFGCVAFRVGRNRGAKPQAALFGILILGAALCLRENMVWPLVIVASILPWLPLPGSPEFTPAMKLSVILLGTTALTHAIFFGEDRYHLVTTPALILLAAGALRRPAAATILPPART